MRLLAAGASVRGPAHEQDDTPNQDAITVRSSGKGCFASIADGLGSRRYSHIGSRRAVELAHQVVIGGSSVASADVPALLGRAWRTAFADQYDQYETTCLWAWIDGDGEGGVGQVGDGLVLIRSQGRFRILTEQNYGFGNQTITLAQAESMGASSSDILLTSPGDGVLLMTDGISDDLIPEQLEPFFDAIYRRQQRCSKRRLKRWLEAELQQWSTPRHGDDKTIASIFRMD
ncbi:Protein phosphatase 2C domain-containing protein [Halomonas sp. NYA30]